MASLARVIRFLLRFSKSARLPTWTFLFVLVMGIAGGFSNTALLAVINAQLEGQEAAEQLFWAFVALCLVMPLARTLSSVLLIRLMLKATATVRMELGKRILQTPLVHLEKLGPHRLLTTLTEDVGAIATSLLDLPVLAMHLAIVFGCVVYLGFLSIPGLLLVLAFMVVGILTYQLPMWMADRHIRVQRQFSDRLIKILRALTEGTKELKLHGRRRSAFLTEGLEGTTVQLQRQAFLADSYSIGAASWGQVLFFVLVGCVLFFASSFGINMQREMLTGYVLTILYMMTPLEAVLNILPHYSRARVAVDQIERIGLSLAENASAETWVEDEEKRPWKTIELAGVRHSYRGEDDAATFQLGPTDLRLSRGELVFLVGGNGSGKTTLAKLILGLYAPEAGEIRLDGEPVDDGNRDRYRQMFSAVFTDFFLFDSLLGLAAVDLDARALGYLEALQLSKKVVVKDGVLSTTALSQGQRKRLALLTAYLEDREIYLFDEWAADQDPSFKRLFYLELLPELKARGKTVIVISHDDHYYQVADRIVRLSSGQIESDSITTGLLLPA